MGNVTPDMYKELRSIVNKRRNQLSEAYRQLHKLETTYCEFRINNLSAEEIAVKHRFKVKEVERCFGVLGIGTGPDDWKKYANRRDRIAELSTPGFGIRPGMKFDGGRLIGLRMAELDVTIPELRRALGGAWLLEDYLSGETCPKIETLISLMALLDIDPELWASDSLSVKKVFIGEEMEGNQHKGKPKSTEKKKKRYTTKNSTNGWLLLAHEILKEE